MTLTHIISDVYGVLLTDGQENTNLLNWYAQQKQNGVQLYLASNVSVEQSKILMAQPHWAAIFEDIFASGRIGIAKPSEAFFLHIEQKVHMQDPEKVLFIDDTLDNVHTSRHLGWQGVHYTTWTQFKKDMNID